jgi:glycosyltransferase involved in cell wall biosynthesis
MSLTRVLFDPQTFLRQRAGGISRLFVDLIGSFTRDADYAVEPIVPFRWTNNKALSQELSTRRMHATPAWLPRGVLYAPAWLRGTPRRGDPQLVHHTYFSRRFLRPDGTTKHVTTIYDMIPEIFTGTENFTSGHLAKRDYAENCDLVICISESTRSDVLEHYGSLRGEVRVIPLSVGPGFSPAHPPLPGLPTEYLVYVGRRAGYKDFPLLARAIQVLHSEGADVPVVVVGDPFTKAEFHMLASMGVASSFLRWSMSDHVLRRAYANARAVVQTSRYEGFGLIPLEGMASGAVVVVANTSAMPEVCGDAARYFVPGDSDSLAEALLDILQDQELHQVLRRRGLQRAGTFNPRRTATLTAEAYRSVVSNAEG